MSLLGPRPVALSRAAAYEEAMAFLSLAKPGFIGPWWLVGQRRPDDIADELTYDLHYLRNYSVWVDVHILVQVSRHILGRRIRLRPVDQAKESVLPAFMADGS
jgi:lipopolysaccharide/colanic/teichoic acid biosynthesis glycosyltransferase